LSSQLRPGAFRLQSTRLLTSFSAGFLCLVGAVGATASAADGPSGLPFDDVAWIDVPPLDVADLLIEDSIRESEGLPPRFAVPHPVEMNPDLDGTWEMVDRDTLSWRLRISSAGAQSLNLGFTDFFVPEGASLFVYATGETAHFQRYTSDDNEQHGELWTPVILGDDLVVELIVPADASFELVRLELSSINVGYRYFGEKSGGDKSGSCNVDVVCPQGDNWRDEIPAIGVISLGGGTFCTGFMVNNTAQDETPYFMTAKHCGINSGNASSLVVYWNYESPTCGAHGGGSLTQHQTGAYWRSAYSNSDFTLVELDSDPNPAWEVTFAGWDNSGNNGTSAVAIHHPSTDEKSISFENQPTTTTSYGSNSVPGDGTHVRVADWDLGTTEGGSSGSPLFDQNHHVIGQLHGGSAACGNNYSDWYGRFSRSWTGGGSNNSRLSNWLDPTGSGATSVDTLVPGSGGLGVTPDTSLEAEGNVGGPFSPDHLDYTLENKGDTGFSYYVSASANWVHVANGSGFLAVGATTVVTLSIGSAANSMGSGNYIAQAVFINTTTGEGNTSRPVKLTISEPGTGYCFGDPGSGTACPCSNDNDGSVPGSGCGNGVFASGAHLSGSGTASFGSDTLVLTTTHLEPNNAGLYFQADNDLSPGAVWGDGLRCAGGNLKRIQVRFADGTGTSSTTIGISAKVGNIVPGSIKRYQCWYRTTNNPPCGAGVNDFNASNGYEITWML
jgi:hypothetical protein